MASPVTEPYHKFRLSVHDYHRMGEIGTFSQDQQVELIDGEVVQMSPIGSQHAAIVTRLTTALVRVVGQSAIVRVQNPVQLGVRSEPQPDIALLHPRADFYALAHPKAEDVLLIVEVGDASLRYDREIKLPLYARHGIPEVWLVDAVTRTLSVCRQPSSEGYSEENAVTALAQMPVPSLTGLTVDLTELF